jgi:hypothetical protein
VTLLVGQSAGWNWRGWMLGTEDLRPTGWPWDMEALHRSARSAAGRLTSV